MVCVNCNNPDTQIHHIKTKGAYPNLKHKKFNLMPLCFKCHREAHDIGLNTFYCANVNVRFYLENLGWEFDKDIKKWMHGRMNEDIN